MPGTEAYDPGAGERRVFLSRQQCGDFAPYRQGAIAGRHPRHALQLPMCCSRPSISMRSTGLSTRGFVWARPPSPSAIMDHRTRYGEGPRRPYAVNGELARVHGKAVIVAAGGWIARHIVRDIPPAYTAAYGQISSRRLRLPNVAVRNWQAFAQLGISSAHWFDGLGFRECAAAHENSGRCQYRSNPSSPPC